MGRLQKSVIDKIVKARKEGYTQAETASKVGVHIKTVQKYDPLRRSAGKRTGGSVETMTTRDLVSRLKTQGDFIDAIICTLRWELDAKRLICPKCMEGSLKGENGVYSCQRCGYEMIAFANVWQSDQKQD